MNDRPPSAPYGRGSVKAYLSMNVAIAVEHIV